MDLSRVIIGQVVTEKSERIKATDRTYTLKIDQKATKVDVLNALKKHFNVEPVSVRIQRVRPKVRSVGPQRVFTKRNRFKKALVTLSAKSKAFDLAQFKA